MTRHEAATPTEERLPAAPTTTRLRQTAASSPTRPATLAVIPPETPVSTTRTPAEGTTEAVLKQVWLFLSVHAEVNHLHIASGRKPRRGHGRNLAMQQTEDRFSTATWKFAKPLFQLCSPGVYTVKVDSGSDNLKSKYFKRNQNHGLFHLVKAKATFNYGLMPDSNFWAPLTLPILYSYSWFFPQHRPVFKIKSFALTRARMPSLSTHLVYRDLSHYMSTLWHVCMYVCMQQASVREIGKEREAHWSLMLPYLWILVHLSLSLFLSEAFSLSLFSSLSLALSPALSLSLYVYTIYVYTCKYVYIHILIYVMHVRVQILFINVLHANIHL